MRIWYMGGMMAAIALAASPAPAMLLTATWTGTVETSSVETSFGGAGAPVLNGLPFTMVFKIDTSKGSSFSGPGFYGLGYEKGDAGDSPMTALVTIGTDHYSVNGDWLVNAQVYDDRQGADILGYQTYQIDHTELGSLVTEHRAAAFSNIYDDTMTLLDSGSLAAPLNVLPSMLKTFSFDTHDFIFDRSTGDYRSYYSLYAGGTFESLAVTVDSVPEPGAWMMMLAGLGVLGMVMRRRRTALADWQ